jgi:hypothetical protein
VAEAWAAARVQEPAGRVWEQEVLEEAEVQA